MKTLKVRTKRMPCGEWSCFVTYNGIDKAFVGGIEVVVQMCDWLKKETIETTEIIWCEPIIHELCCELRPKCNYKRPKIDPAIV